MSEHNEDHSLQTPSHDEETIDLPTRIAQQELLERLMDHLSNDIGRETSSGITLPAAALCWLSTRLQQNETASNEQPRQWRLLRTLLPHATRLRITSTPWPKKTSHPTATIHLNLFPNLSVVWLDKVPVDWLSELNSNTRQNLKVLRIEQSCIYNLSQSVLLRGTQETCCCPALTHLKLSHCDLHERSGLRPRRNNGSAALFRLCPNVLSLNLSHNQLTTDICLLGLHQIVKLDFSYNRLSQWTDEALQNLQVLNLAYNHIESVVGMERLQALKTLHLEHNRLDDLYKVASGLAGLSHLSNLHLQGNPLQFRTFTTATETRLRRINPTYRLDILNAFRERRFASFSISELKQMKLRDVQVLLPQLDGVPPTVEELRSLRARTFVPVDSTVVLQAVAAAARQSQSVALVAPSPPSFLGAGSEGDRVDTGTYHSQKRISQRPRRRPVSIQNCASAKMPAVAIPPPTDLSPDTITFTAVDVLSLAVGPCASRLDDNGKELGQKNDPTRQHAHTGIEESDSNDSSLRGLDENIGQLYLDSIPDDYESEKPVHKRTPSSLNQSTSKISDEATLPIVNGEGVFPEDESVEKTPQASDEENDLPSDRQSDQPQSDDELNNLSLSTIKGDDDLNDLKASGMMTATTADQTVDTNGETNQQAPVLGTISPSEIDSANAPSASEANTSQATPDAETRQVAMSPRSPEQTTLTLQIASFSDHQFQDDFSVPSSLGGNLRDDSPTVSKKKAFRLAEENSSYEGPFSYASLSVRENLELYFRIFVFPHDTKSDYESPRAGRTPDDFEWLQVLQHYPRIQLWPVDRKAREEAMRKELQGQFTVTPSAAPQETFRRVWKEQVIACGKGALRRLTPSRSARYGFHGELLWSAAESSRMTPEVVVECRESICCFSSTCFYVMVDHDSVTKKVKDFKKPFPKPISRIAKFSDAKWPHALACHPFASLIRVTIGFGFQRLSLTFSDPTCSDGFTYILLTSNKLKTVELLKDVQELSNATTDTLFGSQSSSIVIENDDPYVLDAVSAAVAPDPIGVMLYYQIVQQRWKHGDRGTARRVCVVTDTKLFLLDEDYVGDGSDSLDSDEARTIGRSRNRLVDSADLGQVSQIQGANNDPKSITIIMKAQSSFTRAHTWRLLCRDGRGAEKLVEEVRRAVARHQ